MHPPLLTRPPARVRAVLLALVTVAGSLTASSGIQSASASASAASTACPWVGETNKTPDDRAKEVIDKMSVTDEVNMVYGVTGTPYTGNIPANPAFCIPALNLSDGPAGFAHSAFGVTQLPASVAGAASWDTGLMKQYGTVIGAETAGKGSNVSFGPTVNIVRDPRWGRAFESLGEDAYLSGQIGAPDITGIQSQKVMAQVKHLAAYNQETNRNNDTSPLDNAVVDTRTLQETYLPQFAAAVNAGVSSVMCSYNLVTTTTPGNETDWACQNKYLLKTVLQGQFGFQGFVTSDWGATHSTDQAANNGLDMEMPTGAKFGSNQLVAAVNNNQVQKTQLVDMVHRILREMFAYGLFNNPPSGSVDATVTTAAHVATARQVAEEGSVLLKNSGGVLPLKSSAVHSIAVIGDDAGPLALFRGGGSAEVLTQNAVTPYQGIANRASAAGITVSQAFGPRNNGALPDVPANVLKPSTGSGSGLTGTYYNGTSPSGTPVATRTDAAVDFDWTGEPPLPGLQGSGWSAKWTGTLTPPTTGTYTFSLTSDDGSRLTIGGQQVVNMWQDQPSTTQTGTITLTAGKPVPIEVDYYQGDGNSNVTLGWQPPGTADPLTQAVQTAKNSDVAIVFAGTYEGEETDLGGMDLSPNDDQLISAVAAAGKPTIVVLNTGSAVAMPWLPNVASVFEAWYPGQENGNAIAALLFGDVNPSGKLPVTFPASLADVPASTAAQWPGANDQVLYSEGSDVGYRWYDAKNITPAFEFGYGLSYTTFDISNLKVTGPDASGNVTATATVKNTGSRAGAEVAQLYLGSPATTGEPPKRLRGFQRVSLTPGQSTTVTFHLAPSDMSIWSTATNNWIEPGGTYQIMVGDSSSNLPQTANFTIAGPDPSGETVAGMAPNLCLDVRGGSTADTTPIQIYTCNGTAAQVVTAASDGTLRILGKCVDLQNGGTANYTLVQLNTCDSKSGSQQWVPQADGSLLNPQSSRCLDDTNFSTTPGTQAQIYDCWGGVSQRWRIP